MIETGLKRPNLRVGVFATRGGRAWRAYVLVFAIAFVVLFLTTDRTLNLYDEGITLTAGLRVLAGQVPYRDFYFIYGPALPYIFAALFRVFGTTVFIALIFDLILKSLICTTFFAVIRQFCASGIALFFTAALIVWLFTLQLNLLAVTPVSLFCLWTVALLLPVFSRAVSRRRVFAVGVFAGVAGLFRVDAGVALLLIAMCLLVAAAVLQRGASPGGLQRLVASALATLAGFAIILVPALILYRVVAPWHGLYFDLFYYPSHFYRVSRRLPLLRRTDLGFLGEVMLLIPGVTAVLAGIECVRLWRRQSNGKALAPDTASLLGCLCSFGLLTAVMYVKSLVRMDLWQNYLALVPALLLLAILLANRAAYGRVFRGVIYVVAGLFVLCTLRFAEHTGRVDGDRKSLVVARLVRPQTQAPVPPDTEWCGLKTPATRYLCFLVDPDHIHTIEFLRANTRPGDTLYVGLRHHDRVIANDNVTYFATGLLPATHWSHFDPHLQNSVSIQQEMIQELTTRQPPYVVLDSEFEAFNEPNDSSLNTGVRLLDDFIRQQYEPVRYFGNLTILRRKSRS